MPCLIIFMEFSNYSQKKYFILCFLWNEGLNPGVGGLPLKGWPLTVSCILAFHVS